MISSGENSRSIAIHRIRCRPGGSGPRLPRSLQYPLPQLRLGGKCYRRGHAGSFPTLDALGPFTWEIQLAIGEGSPDGTGVSKKHAGCPLGAWQFSMGPAVPLYCRCTPTASLLRKPVSSTPSTTSGSPRCSTTYSCRSSRTAPSPRSRWAARLETARALGAAETLNVDAGGDPAEWVRARTGGRGADRVIEAVGRPEAWELAISLVRKGGTVNLFGGCASGTQIQVDTSRLHYDALSLLGTFHHTPATIREALRLLSEGRVPAEALIQERAGLDHLPRLLPQLARGGGPLKVAITP